MSGFKSKQKMALHKQQEPVGIVAIDVIGQITVGWMKKPNHNDKLYISQPPQQWVGLTEQERNDIEDRCEMIIGKPAFESIEDRLKEKNT